MATVLFLLAVFVGLAHWPIRWFIAGLRHAGRLQRPWEVSVPGWITGLFERLFAFGLVAFEVEEAAVILAAWVAAKLAANWQRPPPKQMTDAAYRNLRGATFIALMAGTLSLAIAAVGGYLARPYLP